MRLLKALKSIVAILIIAALCVGVYIYVQNTQKGPGGGTVSSGTVVINEFMASNSGCLPDENGEYNDWIEIYNPADQAVSLSGMGLSDDASSAKWMFPDMTIPAKGYMIVFASGKGTTDATAVYQHASFKLNAAKGGVYLMDAAKKVLDSISYENQSGDVSMGRKPDDLNSWTMFEKPTPGYSNDEAGRAAFEKSRIATDTTLLITEVMSSNKTTLADNKGKYSDYIEVFNSGDKAVSLKGYGLSDDEQKTLKWKFPDVSVQPGAYLYVFASGEDAAATDLGKGAIHTNFRISSYKQTIVLANPLGLVLDKVSVSEVPSDKSYARVLSGGRYGDKWEVSSKPTPGFANSEEGYSKFEASNKVALGSLIISEVMLSNSEYLKENNGEYYDWIELYNRGNTALDITGYGLTDSPDNPAKWTLPQTTLQPGKYLVVMASGLADSTGEKKIYPYQL